jgi:hypothetical protein
MPLVLSFQHAPGRRGAQRRAAAGNGIPTRSREGGLVRAPAGPPEDDEDPGRKRDNPFHSPSELWTL